MVVLTEDGVPGMSISDVVKAIERDGPDERYRGVPTGLKTLFILDQSGELWRFDYPPNKDGLNDPVFGTVDANGIPTRAKAAPGVGNFVKPQDVIQEGTATIFPLAERDVVSAAEAARECWIAMGVSASLLDGIQIGISALPTNVADRHSERTLRCL